MREACSLIWSALILLFRSRASLAAEILVLRHQINILRRHSPKRQTFSAMDRLIFAGLYGLAPTVLNALARYRYKVAPRRVQIVLALEVTTSWWPTNLTDRDTQAYPRDEHRQSAVGGAPRIHGELLKLGIDIGQTSPALCLRHRPARPQRPRLDQRHSKSDRRMGCTSNNGGISLGRGSSLPHPRSGSDLWQRCHAPIARHGHPGHAYRTTLALAQSRFRPAK